jgi:predicted DNA-binding transcriptional regulator AlpA
MLKSVYSASADHFENHGQPQRYLDTKQAASYLGLSRQYLEIGRHKDIGPRYVKLAHAVRYRIDDLDEYMESHFRRHTGEVG